MNMSTKYGSLLLGMALTLQSTWALEPVTVCYDNQPHPPMLFPDRDGTMQALVKKAAAQVGLNLSLTPLPLKRCRDSVGANIVSAMLGVSYTPLNQAAGVFPMKGNGVDESRALDSVRAMVFRVKGSATEWNGTEFSGLKLPVLLQSYPTFLAKLNALGVAYDDRANKVESNFSKLLLDRGAVVIAFENDGMAALAQAEYARTIEVLPVPFSEMAYYLVFSKQFFNENTHVAESLWKAISQVRSSQSHKAASGATRR